MWPIFKIIAFCCQACWWTSSCFSNSFTIKHLCYLVGFLISERWGVNQGKTPRCLYEHIVFKVWLLKQVPFLYHYTVNGGAVVGSHTAQACVYVFCHDGVWPLMGVWSVQVWSCWGRPLLMCPYSSQTALHLSVFNITVCMLMKILADNFKCLRHHSEWCSGPDGGTGMNQCGGSQY